MVHLFLLRRRWEVDWCFMESKCIADNAHELYSTSDCIAECSIMMPNFWGLVQCVWIRFSSHFYMLYCCCNRNKIVLAERKTSIVLEKWFILWFGIISSIIMARQVSVLSNIGKRDSVIMYRYCRGVLNTPDHQIIWGWWVESGLV